MRTRGRTGCTQPRRVAAMFVQVAKTCGRRSWLSAGTSWIFQLVLLHKSRNADQICVGRHIHDIAT